MTTSVTAGGSNERGGSYDKGARSPSVLKTKELIYNVAFLEWVKRLVMALMVKIRTKKTRRSRVC